MKTSVEISERVAKIADCKFLFIGGAPRSGTTLVAQLFDGHPNVVVMPMEMTFLADFWRSADADKESFAKTFILNNRYQESLFADNKYRQKRKKIKLAEIGQDIEVDTYPVEFLSAYEKALKECGGISSLNKILIGLAFAMLESSPTIGRLCHDPKVLVFKMPYYTELHAPLIDSEVRRAFFIHILRDPLDRYLSAKKRRLLINSFGNKRVARVNYEDFVFGICQVTFSSQALALSNSKCISNYRLVLFEDILLDDYSKMQELALFVGLSYTEILRKSTRTGVRVPPNSAFSQCAGDDNALRSKTKLVLLTNEFERQRLAYLCHIGNHDVFYGGYDRPEFGGQNSFRRFQFERWRDYAWRLYRRCRWDHDQANDIKVLRYDLPAKVSAGHAGVSGAT